MDKDSANYLKFTWNNKGFLGFGLLMAFYSSFGQTFLISFFADNIRTEFNINHSTFGSYYSIATLCSGLLLMVLGRKLDKADLKWFSVWVILGLILACSVMAAAQHVVLLFLAFFALRLTGQGLMSHIAYTSMTRYYDKNRGKAIAIIGMGVPIGEALLPTILVISIAALGWRNTWYATAFFTVLLLPVILYLLKDHDIRHQSLLNKTRKLQENVDNSSQSNRQWTLHEVLKDYRFYLLLISTMSPAIIITGLFIHQHYFITTKAWTIEWIASCFVAYALMRVFGSIVAGSLVDRFGAIRSLPWYLLPLALSMLCLMLLQQDWSVLLYLGLAGLTIGFASPVVGATWAEMYGVLHISSIRATVIAVMVIASAISPLMFGVFIDNGASMADVAEGCLYYLLLATGIHFLVAGKIMNKAAVALN